jgi:hypothetical protein
MMVDVCTLACPAIRALPWRYDFRCRSPPYGLSRDRILRDNNTLIYSAWRSAAEVQDEVPNLQYHLSVCEALEVRQNMRYDGRIGMHCVWFNRITMTCHNDVRLDSQQLKSYG